MAFSRPFAYNSGAPISGTTQFGDLIVGDVDVDYSSDYGGVKWWGGPDEDLRWIIGNARPSGQPIPPGVFGTARVGFWGSKPIGVKTNETFLNLADYVGSKNGQPPFADASAANTWLNSNGYYTNYIIPSPTPTETTLPLTPTPTETTLPLTPTPTETTLPLTPTPTETTLPLTPTPTETTLPLTPTPTETTLPLTPTPTETTLPLTPTPTETTLPLTPTPTETTLPLTPTPTETTLPLTPTPTETPLPLTPTLTETPLPLTPTLTETPTNTPTPSVTPQPVTGYSFNLVALPYNFPSSGNTIMNGAGGATSGTTDPNVLATGSRGIYWNSIDSDGIDRTDYFSGFTGQSITITMSQTGSTAIYSGDTNSLKTWTSSPDNGFVFGAGIGVPPPPSTPSGTAVLIQSASTQWTLGLPVYISAVIN